jgi:hypothetical protein
MTTTTNPITIDLLNGKSRTGEWTFNGDTVAVTFNGQTRRTQPGNLSHKDTAAMLLREMKDA